MSLLEDIFLQDQANEAQELERVIEGDEYDERPRSVSPSGEESDGGRREDEAEEDKRRVDPSTSNKTKRVVKNPRFLLNPARLTGPRGIQIIPEHFKDFKFKGKGHEKEDLDHVLKKLEHWAYRLYPKFQFQDCLKKIETLGKKRPVMVHLHKIRTDQFLSEETVVQKDSSDDEAQPIQEEDEFDKLLQQQIDKARATPAPGSVKKMIDKSDQWTRLMEAPNRDDRSLLPMPKATSSPSISDEQKERMLRNRRLAEERRLARLKQATTENKTNNTIIEIDENEPARDKTNVVIDSNVIEINEEANPIAKKTVEANEIIQINDEIIPRRHRSQVIDSSDSEDECNVTTVNESVVVDVHKSNNTEKDDDDGSKKICDNTDDIQDDSAIELCDNDGDSNDKVEESGDKVDDIEEMTVDDDITENIVDNSSAKMSEDKMNTVENVDDHNFNDKDVAETVVDKETSEVLEENDKNYDVISKDNDKDVDETVVDKETSEVLEENDKNDDVISKDLSENSNKFTNESKEINEEIALGSPKSAKENEMPPKDVVAEEFTEDIMDVDFSDDF